MEDIKKCSISRNEENIAWTEMESEVFIIMTKADEQKVFKLNKSAAYLWKNSDGKRTIQELANQLCLKYEVDEKKALNDITDFIDQMKQSQLATLAEPSI